MMEELCQDTLLGHKSKSFAHINLTAAKDMLPHFEKCRNHQEFIDVVIEVEAETFPCHKLILTACSPYFVSYFSFHKDQEGVGPTRVPLKNLSPRGLAPLLDYMYTGKMEVAAEDALAVLQCGDFLLIREVVEPCARVVQQHLSPDNCVEAFLQAEGLNLPALRGAAFTYVATHLSAASSAGDFHCLPAKHLAKILACPSSSVDGGRGILDALTRWVMDGDGNFVKSNFEDLPKILIPLHIPQHEIKAVFGGMPSFEEVFKSMLSERDEKEEKATAATTEVMVVVNCFLSWESSGEADPTRPRKLYFYHPEEKTWRVLADLPFHSRRFFSVCAVDNKIYVTGGDGRKYESADLSCYKDVRVLDPVTLKWGQKKDMIERRYGHSSTALLSNIFIVGGNQYDSSCIGEIYDPEREESKAISPIPGILAVYNAAVAALGDQVYLVGGLTTDVNPRNRVGEGMALPSMAAFSYNSTTDTWLELTTLSRNLFQRGQWVACCSMVAEQGLLILSGENRHSFHTVYNPLTGKLLSLLPPQGFHHNAGIVVVDRKLFCVCGRDNMGHLQDQVHYVDLWDPTKTWKTLGLLRRDMLCVQPWCFKVFICLDSLKEGNC